MTNRTRRTLLGLALAGVVAAFGYWHWPRGPVVDAAPAAPPVPVAETALVSAPHRAVPTTTAAEAAASILPSLPDGVRGFRSGRRNLHREQLGKTENLAAVVQELERLANAGDADAAAALAEHYTECAIAAQLNVPENVETVRAWGAAQGVGETELAQLLASSGQSLARCQRHSAMDADQLLLRAEAWTVRAGELGDPWSRFHQPPPATTFDGQRTAAIEVLHERGPEGLIRLAPMLGAISGQFSGNAFLMAGCTLVEACAADPEAYGRSNLSILQLGGMEGGMWMLLGSSPRERELAAGQSDHILRMWQSGQLELMLTPPSPPRP